ncbi:flavin reductase family protein [Marinobacter pelagius]|uniref:flavin reductase family protein n=1 Tax=Marinobacter sp. C7 TaxID=2951363 RepID=UPI001EF0E140|nr:flavin reductase family protein [Marinobacter sp. C7]MCG7200260.1 flavin reductase family protein [Marinobacter sp. C7]
MMYHSMSLDTATPVIPPVSKDDFCNGMRNLAGACVVIASGHDGQRAGLTATAVCSISAEPPRLLACVNKTVYAHGLITRSGSISINVLASEQEIIAKRFAGMVDGVSGEARFEQDGTWENGVLGTPVLRDALASFECRVVEAIPANSHDMFVCEVVSIDGQLGAQDPLMYFNGQFSALR